MKRTISAKQKAALAKGQEIMKIAIGLQRGGGSVSKNTTTYKMNMKDAMKKAKVLWEKNLNKLG